MLKVSVVDQSGVVVSREVKAVKGINEIGPFSILTDHAQFICLCTGTIELIGGTAKKREEITVGHGVLHCKDNTVTVYARLPDLSRQPESSSGR